MKKVICLVFLSLYPVSQRAQQAPDLETFTLKNGLKVYLLKHGKIEAISVSVVVNSGMKNETPGQQAFNSITAGLLLQGNRKYSQEQQNDMAFRLGARLSSSSDFDRTSINGNFLTRDAAAAFDLLSAAVMEPLFDKEKVDHTLSYLKDYNHPGKMDIGVMAGIYSNLSVHGLENPLGRNIYKKQLEQITAERLKEFYLFNFTPKNTKIIICGNFNSDSVKTIVKRYFDKWESAYGEINGVALEFPVIKRQETYFVNRSQATQCALKWTKIAPPANHRDALAFTIANMIFNEKLFRDIRETGGKTYGIGSAHLTSQFSNLLTIGCSVRNNEMYNTIQLFDQTLNEFSRAVFTTEEFENEKTRFRANLLMTEHPEQIATFFDPVKYDFEKRKNVLKELDKLKAEDVQKAIKKYFTAGNYKLVIAGDENIVADQLQKISPLKRFTATDLELR